MLGWCLTVWFSIWSLLLCLTATPEFLTCPHTNFHLIYCTYSSTVHRFSTDEFSVLHIIQLPFCPTTFLQLPFRSRRIHSVIVIQSIIAFSWLIFVLMLFIRRMKYYGIILFCCRPPPLAFCTHLTHAGLLCNHHCNYVITPNMSIIQHRWNMLSLNTGKLWCPLWAQKDKDTTHKTYIFNFIIALF